MADHNYTARLQAAATIAAGLINHADADGRHAFGGPLELARAAVEIAFAVEDELERQTDQRTKDREAQEDAERKAERDVYMRDRTRP